MAPAAKENQKIKRRAATAKEMEERTIAVVDFPLKLAFTLPTMPITNPKEPKPSAILENANPKIGIKLNEASIVARIDNTNPTIPNTSPNW